MISFSFSLLHYYYHYYESLKEYLVSLRIQKGQFSDQKSNNNKNYEK